MFALEQGCRLGRPPVKAILRGLLREKFPVISIDEYCTSKYCCGCETELLINNDEPEDEVRYASATRACILLLLPVFTMLPLPPAGFW